MVYSRAAKEILIVEMLVMILFGSCCTTLRKVVAGWLVAVVFVATGIASGADTRTKIVLVAGETAQRDTVGHHDYLAGCQCLAALLSQTPGVETVFVRDGWPANEQVFTGAASVVFYTDGGGKQSFLQNAARTAKLQTLVDAGVGLVAIHQAVDFPDEHVARGQAWLGGVYATGKSGRGHWPSTHTEFPRHAITAGVQPWKVQDGWLNALQFVPELRGITPLVWSGKEYAGSPSGREADIVGWAYERPDGGRSFSFTGLDAHSAWSLPGMRQLVVNGVLWSARVAIPEAGAPHQIDEAQLASFLTPRQPPEKKQKQTKKKK